MQCIGTREDKDGRRENDVCESSSGQMIETQSNPRLATLYATDGGVSTDIGKEMNNRGTSERTVLGHQRCKTVVICGIRFPS